MLIDKVGFNNFYTTKLGDRSVYALVKEGMFHKVKACWFFTRSKDVVDGRILNRFIKSCPGRRPEKMFLVQRIIKKVKI